MTHPTLDDVLAAALADRHLLAHPFYRRWEAGQVSLTELAAYAGQYRHFEAALPATLTRLVDALPPGDAHDLVAANLAEELGDPVPHLELFERFAGALGAAPEPPTPKTAALLATYDALVDEDPVQGLAALWAYESQAAEVARSKAAGLRRHYGLDGDAVSFWDHHGVVDRDHGAWMGEAIAALGAPPDEVGPAARRGAQAWWDFLDEREAAAVPA